MAIQGLGKRLAKALGKDGIDLEARARRTGRVVSDACKEISRRVCAIASIPTHEDRLRKVEEDTATIAGDIVKLKSWILDIDNRTRLLEHFNNYDLDDIRCPQCQSAMRVKKNSTSNTFFFGCSDYRVSGCKGTRPIADPYLEILAKKYFTS